MPLPVLTAMLSYYKTVNFYVRNEITQSSAEGDGSSVKSTDSLNQGALVQLHPHGSLQL